MNQILDYNPNGGGNNSSGSDKLVRVFAVIIIIFALCFVIAGGYGIIKRSQESKQSEPKTEKAKIEVIQEDTQAIIKVTHTQAIEKIIYTWNTGKETLIKATGESNITESIPLPAGENTLHVKVIDINGEESTYENQFISQSGEDILNPTINLEVTPEKKLKITAEDETSLDFITYRWNDEEEQKVEVSEDNKTKIEIEIEILKGVNDLTIVAVDSNNNTTTETKNFTGITKPEVTIKVSADKTMADIYIKHDNGLKEVKLNLNNVDHLVDIGQDNPPEIQFQIQLAEGDNKIIVTAQSIDSTETVATEEVSNNTIEPSITEPTISIEKSEDGQNAVFKVAHESGIKEVKLNVNDVDYNVDIGENPQNIEFLLPLVDGNNRITFTVIPTQGNEKQEIKEISK